jgi:hypothetical protein
MRPNRFGFWSSIIGLTFLVLLSSQMYSHSHRMTTGLPKHKSLTSSENFLVKKSGPAHASMRDSTTQNVSEEVDYEKTLTKIRETRARILLLKQTLIMVQLTQLYAELLNVQKERSQVEDVFKEKLGPEIPLNRDLHASEGGNSIFAKSVGDKGSIDLS